MESRRDIEALLDFVRLHQQEDVDRLLLSAKKYPEVDMAAVVDQLLARRQLREKLPEWAANDRLCFPARIAAEQCSSERTATYKQRLVEAEDRVCDLTGGMGVDSYYLSRKAAQLTYVERFAHYCESAAHNFRELGVTNIEVVHADSCAYLERMEPVDAFYIDPARRGEAGQRVFALSDCEPDLTSLLPKLFAKAPRVIAKISPMADISFTLKCLPETAEIHVLAVRGECKELLFCLERDRVVAHPVIHCVHFTAEGEEHFDFTLAQERGIETPVVGPLGRYLYEPNVAILKAGAFKSVSGYFGLNKLHESSHLYTSEREVEHFPGRRFRIEEVIPFHGKDCKNLNRRLPKANVTVRNFPLSVNELRKRLKIAEGGDQYLFATTLRGEERVLIRCVKTTEK
ncbi:MAG: SAM-dependent methyltransferase [Parabacteroides sp.]